MAENPNNLEESVSGIAHTAQLVSAQLTRAAIFLVVKLKPGPENCATVRSFCADLSGLVRSVEFRDIDGQLSCIMGVGSEAWDNLFGSQPRPKELHAFKEFHAANRHAPATPGDLLFHIRAVRMDLCFELTAQIMERLASAVEPVDEVQAFRYFDDRDLIGFVDGTENPRGQAVLEAVLIGDEDPAFANGSYVIVQKYLHNMAGWNSLPVEQQERIIGRKKLNNIELDDATKPSFAHNALTVIEENGKEVKILRDNMPFGRPSGGEFGTYFIGYSRTPRHIEQMLENMFVGRPPGNYDRLLDFSTAVTGNLFFVPSATFLEEVSDEPATSGDAEAAPAASNSDNSKPSTYPGDGSLGIGSLKGDSSHE
jgi:porphyrinogen peroxidase